MTNLILFVVGQYTVIEAVVNLVWRHLVPESRYGRLFQAGRVLRVVGGLIVTYFSF
jgi:hypothetical protein